MHHRTTPAVPGHFRPRCVVLGLDGVGLELAKGLSSILPNLASLALDPKAGAMDAELPELSPVNWTSFATAAGPGEHGVFGFTRIQAYDYSLLLSDAGHVRIPTIFDRLGERGLVSRVLNLPHAYPARPIAGPGGTRSTLVAGFVAPDLERAVQPPELLPVLRDMGYRIESDTVRGGQDPDFLLAEVRATLAGRKKLLDRLWTGLNFDLFVFILTETDRLGHFLYPALVRTDHPMHGPCMEVLRDWDQVIGAFLDRFHDLPEPKRLLVLADHSFAELKVEVDINAWLRERGYLRLGAAPIHELDSRSITPDTRAFALDPGRIYIHTRERFARGPLAPAQAASLREELAEGLASIAYDGQPVMERIYRREELYQGSFAHLGPDLVCLARPGFDLKAKFDRPEIFGRFHRHGCHAAHGVLYYDSQGTRPARVRDIGHEVLTFFGAA